MRRSLTDAVRAALPPSTAGPVFGAIEGGYQVLLDALVARSGLRWQGTAVHDLARDGAGWSLRDDEGAQLACRRGDPGVARAAAGPAGGGGGSAHGGGRGPDHGGVIGGGCAGACPAGRRCRRTRVCWWPAENGCTPRRLRCRPRKWGARGNAELVRLSFGRFGDADRPRQLRRRRCWPGRCRTWPTLFGFDVEPVDCRVHRWIDAMPQYGPGHAQLVAELRAGLPPALAVAGSYLDGIGVPACVAAAGRAATP